MLFTGGGASVPLLRRNVMHNSPGLGMARHVILACSMAFFAYEVRADVLRDANQSYEEGNYHQALQLYTSLLKLNPEPATEAKAIYNLGLTYMALWQYDAAILTFNRLFSAGAEEKEAGGNLMETYRNYRSNAQWQIGNCYFAQKDYRKAIAAYRATERNYPFRSGCGNAQAEYRYRYAFYQALCHDWLGDVPTATRFYYKAIVDSAGLYSNPLSFIRIVNAYEAGNQLTTLHALLTQIDQEHLAKLKGLRWANELPTDEELLKQSPAAVCRRVLEIRKMGVNKDWDGLISLLKIKGTVAGPEENYARL